MHVLNLLYSNINLRCIRWLTVFLLIYSAGCSEDDGNSQSPSLYQPYSGAPGTTYNITASDAGGFQGSSNTNIYDSGVTAVQTGGVGGTAPVGPVDAGTTIPFDSGASDGSTGVVDTGIVALVDSAIVDSSSGAADVVPIEAAIPDVGGGGTNPGNAPYSPCPTNGDPCKILPLGDSITYGLGGSGGFGSGGGGYRVELFRKALADNKNITFLGSAMNGPTEVDGVPFPRNNEGHSGWIISQIANIVPSPALDGQPHIILLMIGTNDIAWAGTRNAPEQLGALIDEIITAAADALLVVAQITPMARNTGVEAYNSAMPAIIDERAAQGAHIMLVDMYTGFSTNMLADGVHPDGDGYAFMADVWYTAIKDVLP